MRAVIPLAAVLGLVAITLTSCAAISSERTYPTWKGAPLNDLINSWGPPDHDYTLLDGDRIVTYFYKLYNKGIIPWWRGWEYCEAEWRAGADGIVKRFRWHDSAFVCQVLLNKRGEGPNRQSQPLVNKENRF